MMVMSHKGQLLVVTVFALAVVGGQGQKKGKTIHNTRVCHDLIVSVSEIRFNKPNAKTTEEMEQALSQ